MTTGLTGRRPWKRTERSSRGETTGRKGWRWTARTMEESGKKGSNGRAGTMREVKGMERMKSMKTGGTLLGDVPWESPYPRGYSRPMFDYGISELRDKARIAKTSGIVSVLDGAAAVFKSDTVVSEDLREALCSAAKALEDVPDCEKDWQPESDGKVLNLVDPSLWPLVYGKTRVLTDREIPLRDTLKVFGSGHTIDVGDEDMPDESDARLYSTKFQWLPAEVDVDLAGKVNFASYINNLHPSQHAELYGIVERVVQASLPLWSAAYDRVMTWLTIVRTTPDPDWTFQRSNIAGWALTSRTRILSFHADRVCKAGPYPFVGLCRFNMRCDGGERPDRLDYRELGDMLEDDWDAYEAEMEAEKEWFRETHEDRQPQPAEYDFKGYSAYRTSGPWFAPHSDTTRLQVIVKMANVVLTPEKPTYDGSDWQFDGQLNERICATALYCYDTENITNADVAFYTRANAERMSTHFAGDADHFADIYGSRDGDDHGHGGQVLGKVAIGEGRLVVWPNVFCHQFLPFELDDKTKPGHYKFLALFLVDPATPVISSTNVPPQQEHWGRLGDVDSRLPAEIASVVYKELGCPYSRHEAETLRRDLMKEGKLLDEGVFNKVCAFKFDVPP